MPRIINIEPSPRQNKRFRAIFEDGKKINFGLKDGSTFIDHGSESKRNAYWRRHMGNYKERQLIQNMTPSPSLLSAFLLWNKDTLDASIRDLNRHWALMERMGDFYNGHSRKIRERLAY
jgi:hypothetical protein